MPSYQLQCGHKVFVSSSVKQGLHKITCPDCKQKTVIHHHNFVHNLPDFIAEKSEPTNDPPSDETETETEALIDEKWNFGRDEIERYSTKEVFAEYDEDFQGDPTSLSNILSHRTFLQDWQYYMTLPTKRYNLFLQANMLLYGDKNKIRNKLTRDGECCYKINKKIGIKSINQREQGLCKICGEVSVYGRYCAACRKAHDKKRYKDYSRSRKKIQNSGKNGGK